MPATTAADVSKASKKTARGEQRDKRHERIFYGEASAALCSGVEAHFGKIQREDWSHAPLALRLCSLLRPRFKGDSLKTQRDHGTVFAVLSWRAAVTIRRPFCIWCLPSSYLV